ncbi:MAG: hypothetical protein M0Z31_15650 [Clostridia bacterium]|nr:hypothetical protein [Clostridia bacterium]
MKINYETERVAKLKEIIREFDAKELEFLQQHIEHVRAKRKKELYAEWLEFLGQVNTKGLH